MEELFEARAPKGKAILAEIDGVVELQRDRDSRIIKVISSEMYRDEHDLPKGYEPVVEHGDWVEGGPDRGGRRTRTTDAPIVARLTGSADVSGRQGDHHVRGAGRARVHCARVGALEGRGRRTVSGRPAAHRWREGSRRVLRIQGREAVQRYLIDEVQKVYRSQGVNINDKHIEVIVGRCCARCASISRATPICCRAS